jgi:hypothetical protein
VNLCVDCSWLRRRLGPLLICLCVGAAAGGASAQPRPTPPPAQAEDQRARQLFEQGRGAYEDGRYRDAWANFHEAYQLSGRPELLFNIGQTADRLGQDGDALRAFQMYLERLPNAENRRDVENRVRALRERVSNPPAPPPAAAPESSQAHAPALQPAPEPRRARDTPPAPPSRDQATHQPSRRGLYLRAALGFGFRSDSITGDDAPKSFFGWGFAFDLAAGYAVLPGFVVGGMFLFDGTMRPKLSNDEQYTHANVYTVGPFVDWYPKRESLGWHIQGGLGIGVMGYARTGGDTGSPSGLNIVLGTGYEWPVTDALALGVLLRFTAAFLAEDTDSHGFVSPSLAMSATWF